MNFIKLTGVGEGETLYVNLDTASLIVREVAEVVEREIGVPKGATRIGLAGTNAGFFVQELPEQIFEAMCIKPVEIK